MDNKAQFHDIQTELEKLLVKYKNAFPKNLGQFWRTDLLIIPIIVTIIAIIACFNYSYLPLLILIPALVINIYVLKYHDIGKHLTHERNHYHENLNFIKQEINNIDISDIEDYPDVKNYLDNYFNELAAVTIYKNKLANRYRTIKSIATIVIGCLAVIYILGVVGNNISNKSIEKLDPQRIIATIKSADTTKQKHPIILYLADKEPVVLAFKKSDLNNLLNAKIYRIAIVNDQGKPIDDIPYLDFINRNQQIVYSYPIANDANNNIYEINRRIKYLQDNADQLKYTVEVLKWFR